MATPQTIDERIEATRALICQIAEVWAVTCADIDVEVHLPDCVTIRLEAIPRAGEG